MPPADETCAALTPTDLRSEIRLATLDLHNRVLDIEIRMAWWRLYTICAVCTFLQIAILGGMILLT